MTLVFSFSLFARGKYITSYSDFSRITKNTNFQFRQDFTAKEKTALANYKSTAVYDCIQGFLFEQDMLNKNECYVMDGTQKFHRARLSEIFEIVSGIDSAITKSQKLPEGLYLFRGQEDLDESANGSVFLRKGYTSTSFNPHEAKKFYRGVILVIRIPKSGFRGIVMGPWEEEVLLPRNTAFLIVDTKIVNGEKRVLVEPCINGNCGRSEPTVNWENF
ncbi:MAG: ADP-ribosyltransferase [Bdellovibrio sp.]